MSHRPAAWARALLALVLSFALVVQPAAAQSILRDAETEALFADMARPIIAAGGMDPANVKVVLIGDREINAFVAGGQAIYLQSGLLAAADNVGEVQGVIAHELGHVVHGDVPLFAERARGATGISILSLILGAAAMAAGAGEAGMGVMSAGQQAAMGKFLANNRVVEASADAFGAQALQKAKLSGRGMYSFFGKLRQEEYRLSSSYVKTNPFMQSHPMSGERQATLKADLEASPYWDAPADPALEARFQRVKAKLRGYLDDPPDTVRRYPESDQSVPALYARAYAYHRGAYPDKAVAEVDKLIARAPHDPYFLELKGQVLLESGRPVDALPPLREAVERSSNQPLIGALLGHALIATEDPSHFAEAKRVLKLAVARDSDNPFAWYQLGIVYDREGDRSRAALATAERYSLTGQSRLALASAQAALNGIPQGTPDYLRAQDIEMASRAAVANEKRR